MGNRRTERSYPTPSVECSLSYDDNRRLVALEDVVGGASRVNGFRYAWDRVGNRRYESELTASGTGDTTTGTGNHYLYDSAYRLIGENRGVDGFSLVTSIDNNAAPQTAPVLVATSSNAWSLDGAGNREGFVAAGVLTTYVQSVGFPTRDKELNQYSQIYDGSGARNRLHDDSGNVLQEDMSESGRRYFDHANRLVQWDDGSGKDARYLYHANGARAAKVELGGTVADFEPRFYIYDGWQVIAEVEPYPSASNTVAEYVYGEGMDEVVYAEIRDPDDSNGIFGGWDTIDVYYCHNSLGSVTAVLDDSGTVLERYSYEAYGETTILDPDRSVKSVQTPIQPYGFTGRRMDYEEDSGLYYYRLRYYDPEAGRFVSRDPIGMWGDPGQRGNAQNYCGNNPVNRVDPLGLLSPTDQYWEEEEARLGHILNNADEYNLTDAKYDALMERYLAAGDKKTSSRVRRLNGVTGTIEVGGIETADTTMGSPNAAYVGLATTIAVSIAVSVVLPGSGILTLAAAGAAGETAGYLVEHAIDQRSAATGAGTGQALLAGWLFGGVLGKALGWLFKGMWSIARPASSGATRAGPGDMYAAEIREGGTGRAFAGHGEYRVGSGNTTIPEGTSLTMPRSFGIQDRTGRYMERGDWDGLAERALVDSQVAGDIRGLSSYLPGAEVPNLTLTAPNGLKIHGNSITVEDPVLLGHLLEPNTGNWVWAACQKLR